MKIHYRIAALTGIAGIVVACGGGGSSTGVGPGELVTIRTNTADAIVAYQDGDGVWLLATPSGTGTYTAYIRDAGGRYGVAIGRTTQNAYVAYQLTLDESHEVTQDPVDKNNSYSDMSDEPASLSIDMQASTAPRTEFHYACGKNGSGGLVTNGAVETWHPPVQQGADLVGEVVRPDANFRTDLALDYGKIGVIHNIQPGNTSFSFLKTDTWLTPMNVYQAPGASILGAVYSTSNQSAWVHMPKKVAGTDASYMAPAPADVPGGDRIVIHQQSAASGDVYFHWVRVMPGGADLVTPTNPPLITTASAHIVAGSPKQVTFSFTGPVDEACYRIAGFGSTAYLSPKWLGSAGTFTYTTPSLQHLPAFDVFMQNQTSQQTITAVYRGGGFLASTRQTWLPRLTEDNQTRFGSQIKVAESNKTVYPSP